MRCRIALAVMIAVTLTLIRVGRIVASDDLLDGAVVPVEQATDTAIEAADATIPGVESTVEPPLAETDPIEDPVEAVVEGVAEPAGELAAADTSDHTVDPVAGTVVQAADPVVGDVAGNPDAGGTDERSSIEEVAEATDADAVESSSNGAFLPADETAGAIAFDVVVPLADGAVGEPEIGGEAATAGETLLAPVLDLLAEPIVEQAIATVEAVDASDLADSMEALGGPVASGTISPLVDPLPEESASEAFAAAGQPVIDALLTMSVDIAESVLSENDPLVEAAMTAVVAPVLDAVMPVPDAVLPAVSDVAEPVVVPVVEPVVDIAKSVIGTPKPVLDPIVGAVLPVLGPIDEPLVPVLEPVTGQVTPVLRPVAPVVDPVTVIVEPVVRPVLPVLEPVVPVVEPILPIVRPVVPVLEPVIPPIVPPVPAIPVLPIQTPPPSLPDVPALPHIPALPIGPGPGPERPRVPVADRPVVPAPNTPIEETPSVSPVNPGQTTPPAPGAPSGARPGSAGRPLIQPRGDVAAVADTLAVAVTAAPETCGGGLLDARSDGRSADSPGPEPGRGGMVPGTVAGVNVSPARAPFDSPVRHAPVPAAPAGSGGSALWDGSPGATGKRFGSTDAVVMLDLVDLTSVWRAIRHSSLTIPSGIASAVLLPPG